MWLGDLNYRISLSEAKTRGLVNEKNWDMLLDNDQVLLQVLDCSYYLEMNNFFHSQHNQITFTLEAKGGANGGTSI